MAESVENNDKVDQKTAPTTEKKRGGWTHGTKRMEQRLKAEKRRADNLKIATEIETLRVQSEAHRIEMELKKRELEELQKRLENKTKPQPPTIIPKRETNVVENDYEEEEDCRPPPPRRQNRRVDCDYDLFVSDRRRIDRGALY